MLKLLSENREYIRAVVSSAVLIGFVIAAGYYLASPDFMLSKAL